MGKTTEGCWRVKYAATFDTPPFSEGIMHRDVKTANILIDREAVAMLTDYGQSAIDGPVR